MRNFTGMAVRVREGGQPQGPKEVEEKGDEENR